MLAFVLEAALRSLLMALAVWGAIRLLRVQAVVAQKLAWVLVLMAAATMPFVMRAPWLALDKAPAIPSDSVEKLPGMHWLASHLAANSANSAETAKPVAMKIQMVQNAGKTVLTVRPKPSPAHLSGSDSSQELLLTSGEPGAQVSARFTQDSPEDLTESIEMLTATPTRATASAAIASAIKTVSPAVHGPARFWNWQRVRAIAFAVYFGGVALLLLRMTIGLSMAMRIWHRAKPSSVSGQLAASSIRVSRDLNSPVTIGSTVILPADYAEWDEDKLRVVLAHEQSHVRQGDFYLQLAAALYAAAFWFSPLGWWLQRKISELGEALSDCAGLEQAKDAASYAQILLEFAALPRTSPFTGALTGVAMARTSNLSGRIERILNDRRFRLAFLGGRRHAVLTAVLVPAALVATVACIRIVPSVHAAQAEKPVAATVKVAPIAPEALATVEPMPAMAYGSEVLPQAPAPVPPAPATPEVAPAAPRTPEAEAADAKDEEHEPAEVESAKDEAHSSSYSYGQSEGGRNESFAIVHGHNTNVNMSGDRDNGLEKAKAKYHDNFIWFERNGKSYVITDPAIVAQGEAMFKQDPKIQVRQKELEARMKALEGEMKALTPMNLKIDVNTPEFKHQMEELQLRLKDMDKIKIDVNTPEFKSQMEKMQLDLKRMNDVKIDLNLHDFQQQLGKLQSDLGRIDAIKIKAMAEKINTEVKAQVDTEVQAEVRSNLQEQIGEMQSSMGDVQSQIGDIQGMIGDQQGRLGERQGAIGERMGKVGEEMGKLGEEQGRHAEQAVRQMRPVLEQAVKDGKAKPVE
jgi:beta-lactamase regulating signal transducer with metallopeptidase domain